MNVGTAPVEDSYYLASQWRLMARKFAKHRLAMVGAGIVVVFYLVAAFCEFLSPYNVDTRFEDYTLCPPQRIRFVEAGGRFHVRPFVYGLERGRDRATLEIRYRDNTKLVRPLRFFVHGEPYKFWGLFPADLRLFGVESGTVFLLGTDRLGRDMFSRLLQASRVSLSIGLVGVFVSFVLGCVLGGISGYYGGALDTFLQRVIEFLTSLPTIPIWMALSAALPQDWSPTRTYFAITLILCITGWCRLARVVRGKLLEIRDEEFVLAAKIAGMRETAIIVKHLLPSFASYLIVSLTLSIPHMILGETSLSFLGLGLRPPVVSWGVLLKNAQNVQALAMQPWLLIPAIPVVVIVLAFNFLGDGLRDAADPYK